jgi:hypothetical protein
MALQKKDKQLDRQPEPGAELHSARPFPPTPEENPCGAETRQTGLNPFLIFFAFSA